MAFVEGISVVQFAHQHQGLADLLKGAGANLVITGGIGGGALTGLQQFVKWVYIQNKTYVHNNIINCSKYLMKIE